MHSFKMSVELGLQSGVVSTLFLSQPFLTFIFLSTDFIITENLTHTVRKRGKGICLRDALPGVQSFVILKKIF